MIKIITTIASVIATMQCMAATTWYVTKSGSDSNTGKSESAAFLTIQKAIDSSVAGDSVIVSDGTYSPISTANKKITIKSKNGASKTIIDGGSSSRCATLGSTATHVSTTLNGFTLQNGYAKDAGGGGSRCGTVINCIIKNNYVSTKTMVYGEALSHGGGAQHGMLYQCLITGNWVDCSSTYVLYSYYGYGGGIANLTAFNCLVTGNYIVNDRARISGAYGCELYNCIVYRNDVNTCDVMNSRIDSWNFEGCGNNLNNCISGSPCFVNEAASNFRLQKDSPCIDGGDNLYAFGSKDMDGKDRITNGTVDMGAYEWNSTTGGISIDADAKGPFTKTWYVTKSGSDSNAGTSEAAAFLTIQKAINSSSAGDLIIVSDGTYSPISTANKKITIKSKNGASKTIIDGGSSSRCATLGSAATHVSTTLNGFTLQNGYATALGGGGSFAGTLVSCIVKNNKAVIADYAAADAFIGGGGVCYGLLYQCLIMGNTLNVSSSYTSSYRQGGGLYKSRAVNCTILRNVVENDRAQFSGAYGCELYNCIVYRNDVNTSDVVNSRVESVNIENCGNNLNSCISGSPCFVNASASNFYLQKDSPCVDSGDNLYAFSSKDMDGEARITNGTIDMGTYEWNSSTGGISIDDGTGGRQTADIEGDGSSGGGAHYIGDTVTLIAPYVNVTNGWTNIVCTGWANGTGDIPATGTEASYTFTLTKASSLKWVYATNYYVRITAEAGGEIQTSSATDAWLPMGAAVSYTAVASNGWMFTSWLDLGDGVTEIRDNPISTTLVSPCVLRARFKSEVIDYDITDVAAHPRYPWNGKVDLDFTLTCADTEAEFSIGFAAVDQIGKTNLLMQTMRYGDKGDVKQKFNLKAGQHRVTWDAGADIPKSVLDSVKFTVFAGVAE